MSEPEATDTPTPDLEVVETSIIERLVDERQQRPLAVYEIARDHGRIATTDALHNLEVDGLIHRCDQFVFATRAAVRAAKLRW